MAGKTTAKRAMRAAKRMAKEALRQVYGMPLGAIRCFKTDAEYMEPKQMRSHERMSPAASRGLAFVVGLMCDAEECTRETYAVVNTRKIMLVDQVLKGPVSKSAF